MFDYSKNIPEDYILLPLKELLCDPVQGSRPKGGVNNASGGIPSVSAECFDYNGKFDFADVKKIPNVFASTIKKAKINNNDILLVKDGATVGKSALVKFEKTPLLENAYVNEHTYILRINNDLLLPEYLNYYLKFNPIKFIIKKISKASAQEGLNKSFVYEIFIPIPNNKGVQKKIIEFLDDIEIKISNITSLLETKKKKLNDLFYKYLSDEFYNQKDTKSEFLNKKLIKFNISKSVNSSGDVEIDTINSACLNKFGFKKENVVKSYFFSEDIEKTKPKVGEVLLSRSNTPELVGQSAIYVHDYNDIAVSDLIYRIETTKLINNKYLNFYFTLLYLRGDFRRMSRGSSGTMKKINETKIFQTKIPLPDREIQIKIVNKLDKKTEKLKILDEEVNLLSQNINNLRQVYLNKFFLKFFN